MDLDIVIEYRPSLHSPPRRSPLILGSPAQNVTLISGTSGFSVEEWSAVEKTPATWEIVKSLINQGIIRIVSDKRKVKKGNESKSSLPDDVAAAIEIIKKTFSIKLLNEWKKQDTRREIQKAIDAQMPSEGNKEKEIEDTPAPTPSKAKTSGKAKKASETVTSP